jgi:glycosyltransferase involved in cell wall biosynthesis
MIRLFINGLAATAGGGLTYLRNVIPHLSRRLDAETTVVLSPALRRDFSQLPNICLIEVAESSGTFRRFVREQTALPKLIRRSGADVLISTGNFALSRSPVPQILLSRNSLYTSSDFLRDLRARGAYAMWTDTLIKGWFARQSIVRADITVAPTESFAQELRFWTGKPVLSVHHGFDPPTFTSDPTPLPPSVKVQLDQSQDDLRLLFVSHYNYYRNFETLFRALPILSKRLHGKKVKLFLTCRLNSDENPGSYRAESASSLVQALRSQNSVVELGMVPYNSLHLLYGACNIYVTPAYAESFAHPLIEAMSSGLPIVASDLPVHREICGDAGVYFSRFAPEALAEQVLRLYQSPELAARLSANGLCRARQFSWSDHVDRMVALAQNLVKSRAEQN